MTDSILDTTKKALGVDPSDTDFDVDIIMHINSVFATLHQLGLGPVDGYSIADKQANWTDFLGDTKTLNSVRSYMYLRVRLLFDPPATSFTIEAFKTQISEYEWRLNVAGDKTGA